MLNIAPSPSGERWLQFVLWFSLFSETVKMIKFIFFSLLTLLASCGQKQSEFVQYKTELIVQVANYSSSEIKIKMLLDSSIILSKTIAINKVIPAFQKEGSYFLNKGKHTYKIYCEILDTPIVDSIDLKESSYLSLIFRNDLTGNRKDSLNVTFFTKAELSNIEYY